MGRRLRERRPFASGRRQQGRAICHISCQFAARCPAACNQSLALTEQQVGNPRAPCGRRQQGWPALAQGVSVLEMIKMMGQFGLGALGWRPVSIVKAAWLSRRSALVRWRAQFVAPIGQPGRRLRRLSVDQRELRDSRAAPSRAAARVGPGERCRPPAPATLIGDDRPNPSAREAAAKQVGQPPGPSRRRAFQPIPWPLQRVGFARLRSFPSRPPACRPVPSSLSLSLSLSGSDKKP